MLMQYQRMSVIHQNMMYQQMTNAAIQKLSQTERWQTLSSGEQRQLVFQLMQEQEVVPDMPIPPANAFVQPPIVQPPQSQAPPNNPVMQLFNQLQQGKPQPDNHMPSPAPQNIHPQQSHQPPPPLDPIQQLIQQMGGIQNIPQVQQPINMPPTAPTPPQEDNPIKSLLRQLNVNANGQPQVPMDSVWPQPPPQMAPQFNAPNWMAQVCKL